MSASSDKELEKTMRTLLEAGKTLLDPTPFSVEKLLHLLDESELLHHFRMVSPCGVMWLFFLLPSLISANSAMLF